MTIRLQPIPDGDFPVADPVVVAERFNAMVATGSALGVAESDDVVAVVTFQAEDGRAATVVLPLDQGTALWGFLRDEITAYVMHEIEEGNL